MTSVRARIGRNEKGTVTWKSVQSMSSLELSFEKGLTLKHSLPQNLQTVCKSCQSYWHLSKAFSGDDWVEQWALNSWSLYAQWSISNHNNNPAHTRMITTRQRLLPPIHICGSCPASCSHSHLARLTYKGRQRRDLSNRQTNKHYNVWELILHLYQLWKRGHKQWKYVATQELYGANLCFILLISRWNWVMKLRVNNKLAT